MGTRPDDPEPTRSRRRRVLRIVLWSLAALVGLAAFAWVLVWVRRDQDREALDALVARQAAEGRIVTLEAHLAAAEPIDLEAFDAFLAWSRQEIPREPSQPSSDEAERAYRRGEAVGEATARWLDAREPWIREFEALPVPALRSIGSTAWWQHRAAREGIPPVAERVAGMHQDRRWMVIEAAHWFALQALYRDAGRGLRGLDQLVALLRDPGALMDRYFAVAIRAVRDRTHVLLAWRGRLPPRTLDAWLAEPPREAQDLAAMLDAHRVLYTLPTAEALVTGTLDPRSMLLQGADDPLEALDHEIYLRMDAAREAVAAVALTADLADVLRGVRPVADLGTLLPLETDAGMLLSVEMASWRYALIYLVRERARHRIDRLAARLMARGEAPSAEVLRGGPQDVPLVHEELGEGGHRVSVAADAAVPPLLAPWGEQARFAGSRVGRPLISGGWSRIEGSLEWGPAPR